MLVVNTPELLESVDGVLQSSRRVPLSEENYYVYGVMLQHLLTDPASYRTDLLANFGERFLREHGSVYGRMQTLIARGCTEADLKNEILPDVLQECSADDRVRNTYPQRMVRRARASIRRMLRLGFPRIDSEYLRMNSLRAFLGRTGLRNLDAANAIRNQNVALLLELLREDRYITPQIEASKDPVFLKYNLFGSSSEHTDRIFRHARKEGYELSNAQWSVPVHRMHPYLHTVPHDPALLTTSEYLARHIINIPVHPYVGQSDIEGIASLLNREGTK